MSVVKVLLCVYCRMIYIRRSPEYLLEVWVAVGQIKLREENFLTESHWNYPRRTFLGRQL
jgi:hypothetical protein